ncbi:MAG: 3-hydroxyacyl-ACP dehydratase FabZ family protein [Planctomycetota bacterium]
MPSEPLIDFEKVDVATVLASREDVLAKIRQRGRFALLDGILHVDGDKGLIVGFKEIRASDWWAADHIPGRPIFPGALMCEAAAQLCSYDYLRKQSLPEGSFLGFGGMNATRFRGIVQPDCRMIFVARPERLRSRMFQYAAQGFVERELVFETEILGVLV